MYLFLLIIKLFGKKLETLVHYLLTFITARIAWRLAFRNHNRQH